MLEKIHGTLPIDIKGEYCGQEISEVKLTLSNNPDINPNPINIKKDPEGRYVGSIFLPYTEITSFPSHLPCASFTMINSIYQNASQNLLLPKKLLKAVFMRQNLKPTSTYDLKPKLTAGSTIYPVYSMEVETDSDSNVALIEGIEFELSSLSSQSRSLNVICQVINDSLNIVANISQRHLAEQDVTIAEMGYSELYPAI